MPLLGLVVASPADAAAACAVAGAPPTTFGAPPAEAPATGAASCGPSDPMKVMRANGRITYQYFIKKDCGLSPSGLTPGMGFSPGGAL